MGLREALRDSRQVPDKVREGGCENGKAFRGLPCTRVAWKLTSISKPEQD